MLLDTAVEPKTQLRLELSTAKQRLYTIIIFSWQKAASKSLMK
jgi:hypothetical protein